MIFRKTSFQIFFLFSLLVVFSCKSSKSINNIDHCYQLIQKLQLNDNQWIKSWLNTNSIECSKILKFLNDENSSEEVKGYCIEMIKIKMSDEEFKIERLIEFYYLLKSSDDPFNLEKN